MMNPTFTICYEKRQPLRHWLYTEPICLDVSCHYENNYQVSFDTYQEYTDKFLADISSLTPKEGNTETLMNHAVDWKLLRMAEGDMKPTWAVFGTNACFLANCAFSNLRVSQRGTYTCVFNTVGAAAIFVNGERCFEHFKFQRTGNQNLTFPVKLKEGDNTILIALWNVHLHAVNSFSLYFSDTEITAGLPLIPTANRSVLEEDFSALYLSETVAEKEVILCAARPLKSDGQFFWSVIGHDTALSERHAFSFEQNDTLTLPLSETMRLPAGIPFDLSVCFLPQGADTPIQGPVFSFERMDSFSVPRANYAKRCAFLKEKYAHWAELPQSGIKYRILYACLAKLAAGEYFPREWLEKGIAYINTRYDCADFGMHALIRIIYLYADRLSPAQQEQAKKCILNFKYNEDDGGRSMMFCRSENHRILFAALEYLAGKLFPHEKFNQSGEQGIFHQQRGRIAVEKWIGEKGRYGFMEWHSNTYYEEDVIAMLNLYDFSSDYDDIRIRAGNMLDFLGVLIASHSCGGIMATTHGRCYEKNLLYPKTEPTSHLVWLLCGTAEKLSRTISTGALCLITGKYRPDSAIEKIANAPTLKTHSRMGLFFQRGMDGVPCYTYRCPEYMISAALEHRPGICGVQVQTGQILLEKEVPIFCTSFENTSEHTRPSYWGGQYRMPRAIATDHVLAYAYHIETPEGASHCYFPLPMLDEAQISGQWIIGRKGSAYAAVFCSAEYSITQSGAFRKKELLCTSKDAVWIIQLGTKKEFHNFSEFCEIVTKSIIHQTADRISYESPTCGQIDLGFHQNARKNGECFETDEFPLIENNFAVSKYGSGIHYLPNKILNFRD